MIRIRDDMRRISEGSRGLLMTAEAITRALGGRKGGAAWMARCPTHEDREPSLSIADGDNGKILVRCHAGCEQHRVIAALRARGLWGGLRRAGGNAISSPSGNINPPHQSKDNRSQAALRIWGATVPASGTLVETYLAARNIVIPAPAALRFHPAIKHPSGQQWPAMVALVTRGTDGAPLAIHRTFLARDGGGKAPIDPQKMMLGPCRTGAVRLANPGEVLMVGEGIETSLAAMLATGHPVWAALSTSGLRALDLPDDVRNVIVLADGDDAGEAAAQDCAWRWKREGRRVRIARPPRGMDFNDLLKAGVARVEEGT
jgi:putative DNA primase/helicase